MTRDTRNRLLWLLVEAVLVVVVVAGGALGGTFVAGLVLMVTGSGLASSATLLFCVIAAVAFYAAVRWE